MPLKEGPLFSILIPTYNSEETLSVSLKSVENQTFKNVEVLVMDGVSNDETLKIAESFKTKIPGLRVFSEKDEGIYDAMNKAIKQASGEWIFFMGSDDAFYDENVLKTVSETMKITKAKVVYGDVKVVGDTGWAKDGDIYAGEFNVQKLLNQNICHQAMFYSNDFIKKEIGSFSLKYKKSSDWDFNIRCWAKGEFEYIDLIIAKFLAGGFSTNSNDKSIFNDFIDNAKSYFKISLFHPWLNNPKFDLYGEVLTKQRAEYPLRYKFEKLKKRLSNKFS